MGIKTTRVVKFILKGAKGDDAVRYWLIPSVSSVSLKDIESGDGTPTPSSVSVRLVKQVGDDSPITIATPSSVGLTISYALKRTGTAAAVKSYTGAVSVPTNTDYYAIEFYLYRGNQIIDTQTVAIIPDGETGQPGKDGVSYSIIVSPSSVAVTANGLVICESNNITATAYKNVGGVTSEAKDGSMRLHFTTANGTNTDVAATAITAEGVSTYQAVWFEYSVGNKVVATKALVINREGQTGSQGDRGPALRGPQAWSDCAVGYKFQSGAKGEAYKDVVLYQNDYYSCLKSHTKTANNYPGSTTDQTNKYWQLGDKVELIATKILLATYALVKNLGVEAIDMKDANGNILCLIKDGVIKINTGEFNNVVFSGVAMKKRTEVTAANFSSIFKLDANSVNQYDVDLKSCGTWLDIRYLPNNIIIYPRSMRALCGNTILLYNNTSYALSISAPATESYNGGPGDFTSFTIERGQFVSLECKIGVKDGKETAYFVAQKGIINTTLDN